MLLVSETINDQGHVQVRQGGMSYPESQTRELWWGEGRGGEGGLPIILPIIAYYGEASPERGTFFRLQVNKGGGGGGNLLVKVIWVCEWAQRANR